MIELCWKVRARVVILKTFRACALHRTVRRNARWRSSFQYGASSIQRSLRLFSTDQDRALVMDVLLGNTRTPHTHTVFNGGVKCADHFHLSLQVSVSSTSYQREICAAHLLIFAHLVRPDHDDSKIHPPHGFNCRCLTYP